MIDSDKFYSSMITKINLWVGLVNIKIIIFESVL